MEGSDSTSKDDKRSKHNNSSFMCVGPISIIRGLFFLFFTWIVALCQIPDWINRRGWVDVDIIGWRIVKKASNCDSFSSIMLILPPRVLTCLIESNGSSRFGSRLMRKQTLDDPDWSASNARGNGIIRRQTLTKVSIPCLQAPKLRQSQRWSTIFAIVPTKPSPFRSTLPSNFDGFGQTIVIFPKARETKPW